MSSLAILRGSRSLFRNTNSFLNHNVHLSRRSLPVLGNRSLSSVPPPADPSLPSENANLGVGAAEPPEAVEMSEPSHEEADKPRTRRPRITTPAVKDVEPVEIPEGLDILWCPVEEEHDINVSQNALPPPEILEEVYHNLHITLHPQTQHRATYASASGPPVEPTLGLYCPIEGGDYIIDATVRELARRTGAEVLVLDAVQLAAGEWGHFGKAANSLQLPRNPLHFSSPFDRQSSSFRSEELDNDEIEEFGSPMFSQPQQMTLTLMAPAMQGRAVVAPSSSSRRTTSPPSKIKVFFDALVNTPSLRAGPSSSGRTRLIYIRDFPTLAKSSDIWYPPLLSAVRSRRRGPISRPSSAVANPITIIFGMTPPLVPSNDYNPTPEYGLMSVLMSRSPAQMPLPSNRPGKADWGEDEAAEKAREKRLREKLKKWEKNDNGLQSEFPPLSSGNDAEDEGRQSRSDIILIGRPSPVVSGLPPMFRPEMLPNQLGKGASYDNKSTFFRSSVLVPAIRSPTHEKATRVARRQEINELVMRMGIGAVGGRIEEGGFSTLCSEDEDVSKEMEDASHAASHLSRNNHERMRDEWGNKIELWSDVRKIADRAVGNTMSVGRNAMMERVSLEPTVIPWSAVEDAWTAYKANRDLRKNWLRDISLTRGLKEEEHEEGAEGHTKEGIEKIVERLKTDGRIDDHEERLLSCIVNPAAMPTSFNQVHLPPHTIDSVRTMVSLPLLHPQAFKQGILKEHSMTGCLLFGPPGTGKTLVVRALAKEAGCRMLTVSPSDVMDMYVGEGEKLVRAVFSLARKLSPCVIFLDEVDALFGARMSTRETGGAFAHRGVITEFMQEMDGLKSLRDDSIIVIGATNRPFDLDDAVLRRFPRRLLVDLPGETEREEIFKILLHDEVLATDVDVKRLAKQTESFSGSDLKHLCVSAALDAVKERLHLPWVTAGSPLTSQTEPIITVPSSAHPTAPTTNNLTDSNRLAVEHPVVPITDVEAPTEKSSVEDTTKAGEFEAVVPDRSEQPRVLHLRNFAKALKEITPSSSETLGSLAELRKWNEEFGEGRQNRKRQLVWGRGRFGFVDYPQNEGADEGKVKAESDFGLVRCDSKLV